MASIKPLKTFLCLFAQQHPEFRLPELLSLASVTKTEVKFDEKSYSKANPLLLVQFASEESARKVTARSLLIRSLFELWGVGRDHDELEESVKRLPPEIVAPFKEPNYTFKVAVKGIAKKCSAERQLQLYERLSYLPLAGTVNLSNPDHEFHLLEDYGDNPNEAPPKPHRVFLGRLVAHGQRHLIQRYAVRNRYFIGSTSMDAQLSLLMANMAQVKEGSWVFDPFVGTGSLLLAGAHFGGFVTGADIDYLLLHGRGRSSRMGAENIWRKEDESVFSNLCQYGLDSHYLDVLVADAARCTLRQAELFDAIITDPPYGIREGGRKLGSRKATPNPVPPEFVQSYIPAVRRYHLSDLFADLLDFAAKFLVVGGRLVYWLPTIRNEFKDTLIPRHPCLDLEWCCEQPLQRLVGRRLIVMEKRQRWSSELQGQAMASREHDKFRDKYFTQFTSSLPHTTS